MEKNAVQSVERTFMILETLSETPSGLPLMELSQKVGLHKSTVHRLLASLSSLGYVTRDPESGHYKLTLRFFELGSRIVNDMDLLTLARPHLDQLSQLTQEAVHLVVQDGTDIVYIYKVDTNNNTIRLSSRVGLRSPMYCTAVGKSILSTLPREEVEKIWQNTQVKAFTPNTIVELPALLEQLEQVRRDGYAMDNEENELGVRCIGAPLLGLGGKAIGAVSVSAPLSRMDDQRVAQLVVHLLETKEQISRQAGFIKE